VKVDRVMRIEELKRMYGEKVTVPESPTDEKKTTAADATPSSVASTAPMDPAAIAKQNLLARIRAAKTAAGASNS